MKDKLDKLFAHPAESTSKKHWWFSKPLLVMVAAMAVIVLAVNVLFHTPAAIDGKTLADQAKWYAEHGSSKRANEIYSELINYDSSNVNYHFGYITTHYRLPRSIASNKKNDTSHVYRNDDSIKLFYAGLAKDSNVSKSDLGFYGLGLCYSMENKYDIAIGSFYNVRNRSIKYINNSLGKAITLSESRNKNKDSIVYAERCYRMEIANKGNIEGGYVNLFLLLRSQERWKDILSLLSNDSSSAQYCSPTSERLAYFYQQNLPGYVKSCLGRFAEDINSFGFIAALLILLAWLYYLRKIDIFESEKWKYLIGTCFVAMVIAFITFPISDLIRAMIGDDRQVQSVYSLFYCIFGIGIIEETIKFLPLLIGIILTKEIEEPIDYIIYASVSALGFAFIENLEYFDLASLTVIHGRALLTVFTHMFCSSIIAYCLIYAKYRGKNVYLMFLVGLLLAAVSHGVYDYLLMNGKNNWFTITAVIYTLLCVIQYRIFISNALSISPKYDAEKTFDTHSIKLHLSYFLTAILLLEYVFVSYDIGAIEGNYALRDAIISGSYLIFWLSYQLGSIDMQKERWLRGMTSIFKLKENDKVFVSAVKELVASGIPFIFFAFIFYQMTSSLTFLVAIGIRILISILFDNDKKEGVATDG